MPPQGVLNAPSAQNAVRSLPGGHSTLDYRAKEDPALSQLTTSARVLRAMTLEHALYWVSKAVFRTSSRDAHIALLSLSDSSEWQRQLFSGGQGVFAGRPGWGAELLPARDEIITTEHVRRLMDEEGI